MIDLTLELKKKTECYKSTMTLVLAELPHPFVYKWDML